MQRTSRQIGEEIAEAQAELHGYAAEARGILDKAKREDREPTTTELTRFDKLVGNSRTQKTGLSGDIKNRLRLLQAELAETEFREQQVLAYSQNRNQGQSNMYQHPSGTVYNNQFQGDTVLPVNGVLRGEARRHYPQHVPHGTLRAFDSAQVALDSGRWLQAMHTRWQGGCNEQAEQHCRSVGLDISNTMTEGVSSAGGYAVPAPIASAIIAVREKVGVARKAALVMPMTAETLSIPKRAGGVTVYAPGEANSITASDPSLSQIELIAKKRAAYTELSQELSDDAIISLADFIFLEFSYALALQEDNEFINGTGANATYFGVRGLLNRLGAGGVSTAATGHDTWPELDMADMMACVGKLPDRYFEYGASWICSYAFFNSVMVRLAFQTGGATASEVFGGTGNVRSFGGYPCFLTSQMPVATGVSTVSALFGAFNQAAVLGDRGPIRLARSEDFKFQSDVVALRVTSRYDINVHDSGDASLAGAYVGLKTAS